MWANLACDTSLVSINFASGVLMLWVLPIFRSSTPVSDVFAMSLDPTLQPIDKIHAGLKAYGTSLMKNIN